MSLCKYCVKTLDKCIKGLFCMLAQTGRSLSSPIPLMIFLPGGSETRVPGVRRRPDASCPPLTHFHHFGWDECGPWLRPGGDRGSHEDPGDQHSVRGRLAHPGVWLQPSATPEHRPVPRGRHLCGQVEVYGHHFRFVTTREAIMSIIYIYNNTNPDQRGAEHQRRVHVSWWIQTAAGIFLMFLCHPKNSQSNFFLLCFQNLKVFLFFSPYTTWHYVAKGGQSAIGWMRVLTDIIPLLLISALAMFVG